MTLLHQAAQKAVEALTEEERSDLRVGACVFRCPPYDKNPQSQRIADLMERLGATPAALQHQEVPREQVADFDTWQQNPYTKVLLDSIKNDYMPRADAEALIRAAASPSTTRQQEAGSNACQHQWLRDKEHPRHYLCKKCGTARDGRLGVPAAPSTPENAGGVATGYDGVTTHPEFGGDAGGKVAEPTEQEKWKRESAGCPRCPDCNKPVMERGKLCYFCAKKAATAIAIPDPQPKAPSGTGGGELR